MSLAIACTCTVGKSEPANGDETVVTQVFPERSLVVAKSGLRNLRLQDDMIVALGGNRLCLLRVVRISGTRLTLDSRNCRFKEKIKAGLILKKSLLSEISNTERESFNVYPTSE